MRTLLTLVSLMLSFPASAATVEVFPRQARPGDAVLLTVREASSTQLQATVGGRPVQFFERDGVLQAVVGLPVETPIGPLKIVVASVPPTSTTTAEPESWSTELEVIDPKFPARELKVAKQFVEPPPELQAKLEEDRKAFADSMDEPFSAPMFGTDFGWPRNARTTAPFGDLRTFNGVAQSQHFGIDLDGKVGAPIYATNDGTVVMVRDNHAAGQTVILHHGANVYSLYFHLSKFLVKPGQKVKRGHKLGLVGRTGRVTGPHLHWSMKVGDLYVDPASILRLPLAKTAEASRKKP